MISYKRKKVDLKNETSQMRIIWGNSKCSPLLFDFDEWIDFDNAYERHKRLIPKFPSKEDFLKDLLNLVAVGWIEKKIEEEKSAKKNEKKKLAIPYQ